MAYEVNSVDLCASGYERLRSQSEIILTAYPTLSTSVPDLRDELIADLNSCARPDNFDYDYAREVIWQYFSEEYRAINCLVALSAPEEWTEEMEGAFFLYLELEA